MCALGNRGEDVWSPARDGYMRRSEAAGTRVRPRRARSLEGLEHLVQQPALPFVAQPFPARATGRGVAGGLFGAWYAQFANQYAMVVEVASSETWKPHLVPSPPPQMAPSLAVMLLTE
jgi:hypothetical protein